MLLKILLKELGMSSNISESYEKINAESEGLGPVDEGLLGVARGAVALLSESMNNNIRKRVSFDISVDDDDSFDEKSVIPAVMCPPLESSNPGLSLSPDITANSRIEEVGDEFFSDDHGVATYSRHNIAVITISDNDESDIGAEYVKDAICESELLLDGVQAASDSGVGCNICDKVFKRKYDLLAHLSLTHYKARLSDEFAEFGNICPLCEEDLFDHDANLSHIGRDHGVAYQYYEADFPANRKEKSDRSKELDRTRSPAKMKVDDGNGNTEKTSSLKGILKRNSVIAENVAPKSILRAPRPKSSTTTQSILKHHKYFKRRGEKSIQRRGDVKVERSGENKVILSVQDIVGDTMVDAVEVEEGNSQIKLSVQDDSGEIMFDLV